MDSKKKNTFISSKPGDKNDGKTDLDIFIGTVLKKFEESNSTESKHYDWQSKSKSNNKNS